MKIRPVGAELFHEDRRTDGRTDMTKLVVAFCNFANTPNKKRQNTVTEYFNLDYNIYTIFQLKFVYLNDANSRQELSGCFVTYRSHCDGSFAYTHRRLRRRNKR
jgi:hypothetical protein